MPRNTGRGSRAANKVRSDYADQGMWSRRNTSSGHFHEAKKHGGAFKGVRREGSMNREDFKNFVIGFLTAALITGMLLLLTL